MPPREQALGFFIWSLWVLCIRIVSMSFVLMAVARHIQAVMWDTAYPETPYTH